MAVLLFATTILCTVWITNGMIISPTIKYDHNSSLVADDIYNIFWSIENDRITFEVHVKTLGYVGFGLSKTGGMKNADIVIGWIKDGKIYFQDRYATRNAEPEIDASQDWNIIAGREEGNYTILIFSRALTNCDPADVDVTDETMRVIYSFHENDPVESTGLPYHGRDQRGTKSFTFIYHTAPEEIILPQDAISMDFVVQNIEIPAVDTTYYCHGFRIPHLEKKHHVIMMEPLIQKGNEGLVHHMILYACSGRVEEEIHGEHGDCELQRMQDMQDKCNSALFLYAQGTDKTFLPKETGVPLGDTVGITHFRLEIHYNNPPPSPSGLVDSSGLRLWMTPTLRMYDAWMLTTGIAVRHYHVIPPYFHALTNYGYCPSQCLSAGMNGTEASDGIHVIAVGAHSHLLGTKMRLRHFRDGVELPPIFKDDNFDFNFQFFKILKEPVTIKPTDDLITECTYNSENRDNITYGGWRTQDEMCFIFAVYYPRMSHLSNCLSIMPPASIMKYTGAKIEYTGHTLDDIRLVGEEYEGKRWKEIVSSTDWSDKHIRSKFQNAMIDTTSNHGMVCKPHEFWVDKPFEIRGVYEEVDECKTSNAISIDVSVYTVINLISMTLMAENILLIHCQ